MSPTLENQCPLKPRPPSPAPFRSTSTLKERNCRPRRVDRSLRDRRSVPEPSAVQVRGAGPARGDPRDAYLRRARLLPCPGRARTRSRALRSTRSSGVARATSTGATNAPRGSPASSCPDFHPRCEWRASAALRPRRRPSGDLLCRGRAFEDVRQPAERPFLGQELRLGTALHHPAALEHEYLVRATDGREAVGDDDRRPSLAAAGRTRSR